MELEEEVEAFMEEGVLLMVAVLLVPVRAVRRLFPDTAVVMLLMPLQPHRTSSIPDNPFIIPDCISPIHP